MARLPHVTLLAAAALLRFAGGADAAPQLQIIHQGEFLQGGIVIDAGGNLYAATTAGAGSAYGLAPPASGQGQWTGSLLWNFRSESTLGVDPVGGLAGNATGPLYGSNAFNNENAFGCGSVFTLRQRNGAWRASLVWSFNNDQPAGACIPYAAPAIGADGALYGTASEGGTNGYGAIYKITPPIPGATAVAERVIYSFKGAADGYYPDTPVLAVPSGAIFGTALGSSNHGPAMTPIYMLTPPSPGDTDWQFTLIWRFVPSDCVEVTGSLAADASGAIYGACGDTVTNGGNAPGTVFRLTPPGPGETAWHETILWRFTGGPDGGHPNNGVTLDSQGNLYGTALAGNGTIFRLTPPPAGQTAWAEQTLWAFSGADGQAPSSPLVLGPGQNPPLFGTTMYGGAQNAGTVFKLIP